MLSRLQAPTRLFGAIRPRAFVVCEHVSNQKFLIPKRWSGHNAVNIRPANTDWKFALNWMHFYIVIGLVPMSVITTIINIRANPELSEVPEGYEPRHWEYYKHPITRFIAKYFFNPIELDHEVMMALHEEQSESKVLEKLSKKCEKVMKFYNDHRSIYFMPYYGEYFRSGRDEAMFKINYEGSQTNQIYELAYDPNSKLVPTEGYSAEWNPADSK